MMAENNSRHRVGPFHLCIALAKRDCRTVDYIFNDDDDFR